MFGEPPKRRRARGITQYDFTPTEFGPPVIKAHPVYYDDEFPDFAQPGAPAQPEHPMAPAHPEVNTRPQRQPLQHYDKFGASAMHHMQAGTATAPPRPPVPVRDFAPKRTDVTGYSKFGQAGMTHRMAPKPERQPSRNERSMSFGAVLSAAAYAYGQDRFDSVLPTGIYVDQELSDRESVVFVSQETGKAYISYRGTNFLTDLSPKGVWETMTDLAADALITVGAENALPAGTRFTDAMAKAQKVTDKYGKENVEALGHSLGGNQAMYVNARLGIEARAYNPGYGPGDLIDRYLPKITAALGMGEDVGRRVSNFLGLGEVGKDAPVTVYHSKRDPISIETIPAKGDWEQVNITGGGLLPHGIQNFTGEEDVKTFAPQLYTPSGFGRIDEHASDDSRFDGGAYVPFQN